MYLTNCLLLLLASSSTASAMLRTDSNINAKMAEKLLSKARRLNNNGEVDTSWVPDYSLKFQKCHSLVQVAGEGGGGGEGAENGQIYTQNLIEFALCPSSSCSTGLGCSSGAKYIVNMREFVEVYMEFKQEELEQQCEYVAGNCNCQYANDDEACANQCLIDAGLEACIEVEGEENDMERYRECEALEQGDNNNNANYNYNYNNGNNNNNNYNYYQEYFVGPYCSSDGNSIHLGVFQDEGCSIPADDSVFEAMNYGKTLPYSKSTSTSMVLQDCISCEKVS